MVKAVCLDIYEAGYSMKSKKNLDILDFSFLETFWKKVEEDCSLSFL
jgi:hypothetical protein